jgi:hypothetical protein
MRLYFDTFEDRWGDFSSDENQEKKILNMQLGENVKMEW